ncbi:MAG: hypothetical protein K2L00_04950, partial [Muribaculaceae bacterium]|nr:hypothetical protein [Muribaculaceae bacterium]
MKREMKKDRPSPQGSGTSGQLEKRRKYVELGASCGLLLVLAAMTAPFLEGFVGHTLMWAKWVYAAGALVYTAARVVDVNAPGDSLRLRRLRRLEFWAGVCFIVGAAFWFYKVDYYSGMAAGPLAVMRQTVAFTMAGAVIQIVASWLIAFRMK